MNGRVWLGALLLSAMALGGGRPALAARCGGGFNPFVRGISAEAVAAGVSQGVVSSALGGVTEDGSVLAFDRRQRYTFNKTFEQYVSTRVGPARINGGRALLSRNAALFARIEQQFGVPRQIIVAIWGLETDFGKGDMGKLPVIRTLTTLAHDCRRTDLFQGELLAALKIVQRGDLRHFVPDVLASTANLLHTNGFKMGAPYGEGSANFEAMREWNHAVIYRKTIAYFADQLIGR